MRAKSGTLESGQKTLSGAESPGMSMSTSTPLFKKKNFVESPREPPPRRDVGLDLEKRSNGGFRDNLQ